MTAGRRDQLASALAPFSREGLVGLADLADVEDLADALAPVVDRMIRQAQAEALESAAREFGNQPVPTSAVATVISICAQLLDRAAALAVTTDRRDVTQDAP